MTYEEAREKAGFKNDRSVAIAADISPSTISEWRKGKYLPNTQTLRKIAAVLDCTIDDLIEG